MSMEKHHCIILIGSEGELKKAKKIAASYFPKHFMVSGIIHSPVNGVTSLYIAPDGSGDGWATSNEYDKLREHFYLDLIRETPSLSIAEVALPENGNYTVRNVRK